MKEPATSVSEGVQAESVGHRLARLGRSHPWWTALLVCVLLLVLMYPIENWRGRRAWERTKRELEAKGEVLDFAAFKKPPVPEDQNVIEHPFFRGRFLKGQSGFGISAPSFEELRPFPYQMEDLKKVPRDPVPERKVAELVTSAKAVEKMERVLFTETPFKTALKTLAEAGEIRELTDSTNQPSTGVPVNRAPAFKVSLSLTNATAAEAIDELLKQHGYRVLKDEKTSVLGLVPVGLSLKEIGDVLDQYEAPLTELKEAFRRPYVRIQDDFEDLLDRQMPNFVALRTLAQTLASSAKVRALLDQPDKAMRDITLLRRTADCCVASDPPTLVDAMIRVAIAGLYTSTVEEILQENLWRAEDLAVIQKQTENFDLISAWLAAIRGGERAAVLEVMDKAAGDPSRYDKLFSSQTGPTGPTSFTSILDFIRAHVPDETGFARLCTLAGPKGWFDQNKVTYANAMQVYVEPFDAQKMRVDAALLDRKHDGLSAELEKRITPYNYWAHLAIPNLNRAAQTLAKNQTSVSLCYVVCSLERYRLTQGKYPDSLSDIPGEIASQIPHDLFDGKPLRYRLNAHGGWMLYSIGWNNRDDGGDLAPLKNGWHDWKVDKGDWGWDRFGAVHPVNEPAK